MKSRLGHTDTGEKQTMSERNEMPSSDFFLSHLYKGGFFEKVHFIIFIIILTFSLIFLTSNLHNATFSLHKKSFQIVTN